MYFGNRDGYLRDIEALDIGYVMRVRRFAEEEDSHPLLPVAFKDHIIGTLAPERSVESTWSALIRKNAAGERAEWELFKRLWLEYETRVGT